LILFPRATCTCFHSHCRFQKKAEENGIFNLNYLSKDRKIDLEISDNTVPYGGRLKLTPIEGKLGVTITRARDSKGYELTRNFNTFDQVVYDIHQRFKLRYFENMHFDFGEVCIHDRSPDENDFRQVICKAMTEAGIEGNKLSEENTRQISIYFNQFLPRGNKKRVFENIEGDIIPLSTEEIDKVSIRLSELDRDVTAIF
jgi:type III restriction enzyme